MENNKENSVFSSLKTGSGLGSGQELPSRNQFFAKKLKERRELFGFTQVELAEKIGSNKGTIQNYESGSLPKGDYAIALAEVLKCSLDWLLMDKGSSPDPPGGEKQVDRPVKWYRYSGHLEKCVIRIKLLEVQNDNEEKELLETI